MSRAGKSIGLLGGTFDPVHNGHLEIAQSAYLQLSLDEVWLMVSPDPPHKKQHITPFEHRFNMVSLAAKGYPSMVPTDYETRLPQPSYTAQTLKALKEDYPEDTFYFIIGEDSLDAIESWYHPAEVMALTELIVSVRNVPSGTVDVNGRNIHDQAAYLSDKYGAQIHILNSDYVDISSTELREKIKKGESIDGLVPAEVAEYIWTEKLYTT